MTEREQASDGALVRQALDGSLGAFEQLVCRHENALFRFLLARSACRADAEDALQEAFVAAWRYLGSYRSDWAFSTWLYRIALRRLGRLARRPTMNGMGLVDRPVGDTAVAEEQDRQRRATVWETARRVLGRSQLTVLWLYYVEDWPVAEIARAMGRPQSWTKVNLHRARKRLSRELDPKQLLEQDESLFMGESS